MWLIVFLSDSLRGPGCFGPVSLSINRESQIVKEVERRGLRRLTETYFTVTHRGKTQTAFPRLPPQMCAKGPENCRTRAQRLFVNLKVALFAARASAARSKARQVAPNKLYLPALSPHLLHKKMGSSYCAISCRSRGSDMTSRCVSIIARVRRWRRVGFVPGRISFF